jgi:hypothetical protein
MRVLYLHGFASGPTSSKGRFFREKFGALGVEVETPDLEAGDFAGLTLTRQLEAIDQCVQARRFEVLIGSSLGGYLAALYAARHPGRFRLVLLAPGFGFAQRWPERLGAKAVREWRKRGWLEVYHYGRKQSCRIGYQLLEDGSKYEIHPDVRDPTLILHGVRDEVVPLAWSEEFAAGRPHVRLVRLESDHQLLDALDRMWEEVEAFLTGPTETLR